MQLVVPALVPPTEPQLPPTEPQLPPTEPQLPQPGLQLPQPTDVTPLTDPQPQPQLAPPTEPHSPSPQGGKNAVTGNWIPSKTSQGVWSLEPPTPEQFLFGMQ